MTHLIVVGRPDSGVQALFQSLLKSGLSSAKPSHLNGLSPAEINAKILGSFPSSSGEYAQHPLKENWKTLLEDFAGANVATMGWADPKALPLLELWKAADVNVRFLFVYAPPSKALAALREVDSEAIEKTMLDWHAYNAGLLSFYNRNRDRCLLVNGSRTPAKVEKLNALLGERFGVQLNIVTPNDFDSQEGPLSGLCALVADQYEDVIALYDEMEATTSLPDDEQYSIDLNALLRTYRKSLDAEELLILQLHTTQEELEHYYLLSEKSRKEFASLSQQAARDASELLKLRKPIGAVERVRGHLNYRVGKTVLTCSNSILGWLCLPAALAYQVLEFRADRRRMKKLPKLPLDAYVDVKQAQKIQTYLSYRLGSAITANATSLSGWLRMPSAIRHELHFKLTAKK